jgi:hypothetical protein
MRHFPDLFHRWAVSPREPERVVPRVSCVSPSGRAQRWHRPVPRLGWFAWFVSGLFCVVGSQPGAQNTVVQWPRFRGPNGSGVSEIDKPPIVFGPSASRLWQAPVPPGHSSPVVWQDRIFLTAVDKGRLVVIALRRSDGGLLWQRHAPAETLEKVHPFNLWLLKTRSG